MREILMTSSVLILVLLVLRRMFRKKISRRVQYALWGLVLMRLLFPVTLPALDFSVLTMAEPVRESISLRLGAPAFTAPETLVPNPQDQQPPSFTRQPWSPPAPAHLYAAQPASTPVETPAAKHLTLTEVLVVVWLIGAVAMTVWLLASNFGFAAKLRRSRVSVKMPGCRWRVYMVESGLSSPCLFGLPRPAIYLTPSAVQSEASLRHVLAHEEIHAQHLDPLWSLLRCVCLAVYWFDPLVWIAASASKTDCELACDEGVIRRLGEEERLAYGKTLLSLIPIRRLPGNPLLSTTTMSSDKKRLQDRITRVAENPRTRKVALCVMILLTAGVCLITFAGCAESAARKDSDATVTKRQCDPITAEELRYFNEQFFNGDYLDIRQQFLSSMYDDPADINLFELFYCGAKKDSFASAEEQVIFETKDGFLGCPVTRVSTAEADEVLLEYTGLTLAETSKVGLGGFTYLPEFDAYFNVHGDTNYRSHVDIIAGELEGDLIHLYYDDDFFNDGWKCVTLRETESGGYHFVSNLYSAKSVISTAYPEGEPLFTIPLTDLTPYEPQAVEVTHHSGDCEERFVRYDQSVGVQGHYIRGYRSTDGNIYVAEVMESAVSSNNSGMAVWEVDCFAVMPNDKFSMDLYTDLFGQDGFILSYTGDVEGAYKSYYTFDEGGTLRLLCTVPGYGMNCQIIDMNGDGVNELLCTDSMREARLYFQRDGMIHDVDVARALLEAWPEGNGYMEFGSIAPYTRFLSLWRFVTAESGSGAAFDAMAFRSVYFDGDNLLVYNRLK